MQKRRICWFVLILAFLLFFLPGCKGVKNQADDDQLPIGEGTAGEAEEAEENIDMEDVEEAEEEEQDGEETINKDTQLIVTGDNVALRKTPGTTAKPADDVLARLKRDQKVFLQDKYDDQMEADGYVWWEIYDPTSQFKGWCAAKYLAGMDTMDSGGLGTIEGSITFPAEVIPDGLIIVVEDVATQQEFSTDEIIYDSKYQFGAGFIIKVPPGNYYVYAMEADFADFRAYYDEYMQSDFTTESYEKIVISIAEGQHVDDILVGNWWRPGYP